MDWLLSVNAFSISERYPAQRMLGRHISSLLPSDKPTSRSFNEDEITEILRLENGARPGSTYVGLVLLEDGHDTRFFCFLRATVVQGDPGEWYPHNQC